jgi:hypothetical protein
VITNLFAAVAELAPQLTMTETCSATIPAV